MNLPPLPEFPADAEGNDLAWHALNYRTAHTIHAEAMWKELEAYVRAYGKTVQDACRATVLGVGMDATAAAAKPDVAMFHTDSYISGYSDACVDCDEAIRNGVLREGEGNAAA